MKPSRELQLDVQLLAGVAEPVVVLVNQIAQHNPEIRHRLTSAWITALDTTDRDALVGHRARLLHQLRESTAAQLRRPPQMHRGSDRRVDIIGTKDQRGTPHRSLDLRLVARRSFALPSTHVPNDTGGGSTSSPLPQTPTQRPTGARVL
jgi:hypothetical protein